MFQIVYNVTVEHDGKYWNYETMCAKWDGYCYDNEILRLSDIIPSVEANDTDITYPMFFHPYTFEVSCSHSVYSNFEVFLLIFRVLRCRPAFIQVKRGIGNKKVNHAKKYSKHHHLIVMIFKNSVIRFALWAGLNRQSSALTHAAFQNEWKSELVC